VTRRLGIVTALAAEARVLAHRAVAPDQPIRLGQDRWLWLCGMGPSAAHEAAEVLLRGGADALAVFGVAGGLAPGLRSGTLFCPSLVVDAANRAYRPTPDWQAALAERLRATTHPVLDSGALLGLDTPLLGAADKQAMHARHQALAVDMESAAVAAVASERKIPFVVLRAIVDECDDEVPLALQASVDAWGRPRPLALLVALGRQPGLLARLPRLASRMRQATRALRVAADAAGEGWARESCGPC
jgi:nucleoside phosphorylase